MNPVFSLFIFHLTFALTVAFQSCSRPDGWKAARPLFNTNPVFYPYVDKFEFYSRVDTRMIPIRFSNLTRILGGTPAGVCHTLRIGKLDVASYIEINESFWYETTDLQKTNIIFHELGHCALHLEHVPLLDSSSCPTSMMNSYILSQYCLEMHYDEYIREMFPLWKE